MELFNELLHLLGWVKWTLIWLLLFNENLTRILLITLLILSWTHFSSRLNVKLWNRSLTPLFLYRCFSWRRFSHRVVACLRNVRNLSYQGSHFLVWSIELGSFDHDDWMLEFSILFYLLPFFVELVSFVQDESVSEENFNFKFLFLEGLDNERNRRVGSDKPFVGLNTETSNCAHFNLSD